MRASQRTVGLRPLPGLTGVVDSAVFQRTVDYSDEMAPGYHVALDTGPVIAARPVETRPL